MNQLNTQTALPDPSVKVLTLAQYREVLAVFYGGSLSTEATTQAFLNATKGEPLPFCVFHALKLWKNPRTRQRQLDRLRAARGKIEAEIVQLIDSGFTSGDAIAVKICMARSAVHPILRQMYDKGLIHRVKFKSTYIYSPIKNKDAAA